MDQDSSGIPDSLRHKFPDMRPVKRTPTLVRINGIGFGMYGRRDFDAETRTYVKTYCFCVLFVPLFAIASYRVVDAARGWYFIGKERLSSFAKSCNFGVVCLSLLLVAIIAENNYKSSPDYRAKQELQRADNLLKSGSALDAARLYREVAVGAFHADEAKRGLAAALEQGLSSASPQQLEETFKLLAGLPPSLNSPTPLVPNAYDRGVALVQKLRTDKPENALDLLRQVAPLGPTNNPTHPLEIDLLKAAISANPDRTNRVVELALIYEGDKRLDDCYQLLTPYREKLGSSEGARILGQHLLQQAKYEPAYALLYPYVQARLEQLRTIEANCTNAEERMYRRAIDDLEAGRGDQSFYDAYKKASQAEKKTLVQTYIQKRVQADPASKRLEADLTAARKIVVVTLDLGMVQLSRAQNLTDPAARKAELQAAEKTFLAIRGLAGDTDEYRLFLGQVDYWLGKSREGQELFDQLLASSHRSYLVLMELGRTLRDVGDHTQARAMAEEAYRTATTTTNKFAAAAFRAHIQKDTEDHIAWLEKADVSDPAVQIALNNARGEKALEDGNRSAAADYLRKASAGYAARPANSTIYNNWGLVCLNLYQATGNLEDNTRGLELLEKAVALAPSDSVLLINTMHHLFSRAVMNVVQDSIRVDQLAEEADTSLLAHLYSDEAGDKVLYQKLSQDPSMQKALAYLDKGMLLSPKSVGLYRYGLHYRTSFKQIDELEKLDQRFKIAAIDFSDSRKREVEAYRGAKDKELLARCQSRIRTLESVLQLSAVKDHPLTWECAQVSLIGQRQAASIYGNPLDADRLLGDALGVDQKHSSAATASALISAHFFRANDQLARQNAQYKSLVEPSRRALAPQYLVTLVLDRGGPLADMAACNTNVVCAIALAKDQHRRFPSYPRADLWALFHRTNPTEAALVAKDLNSNKIARLSSELEYEFDPVSGSAILEKYWLLKLDGNEPAAAKVYQQAIADGVPLPP
jgi:hypothetical protein